MSAITDPPAVSNGKGTPQAAQAAVAQVSAPADLPGAVKALAKAADETKDVVVESDDLVDALYLGVASKTHVFVCGSGGVGKTFAGEILAKHFDTEQFYVQFRADMKREEVFGPLSMTALQRDEYVHITKGYMPEARLAALDEFKDGGRFLRQLLNILNERWFKNGDTRLAVPLVSAIGATNFWVEEPELEALFDRLAQRLVQEPVKTSRGFKKILKGQLARDAGTAKSKLTVVTWAQLEAIHAAVDVCRVDDALIDVVDKLRTDAGKENLHMSPRRWGEGLKIARAAAVLAGRDHVIEDDLRPFARILPSHPDDFKIARDLCKAFRDKFTEAVEESRAGLAALKTMVQPQIDKVGAGESADMGELTNISREMKTLVAKVEQSKGEHPGRDTSALDKVLSEVGDIKQFLSRAVLGG